jgi:hypothetical protein
MWSCGDLSVLWVWWTGGNRDTWTAWVMLLYCRCRIRYLLLDALLPKIKITCVKIVCIF